MNASAEPEKQTQYKPNTKPIKANTNPISERPKMNENLFATKVYENITTFRLEQNKPNQTQSNPILSAIAPVLRSFSGEGLAKADSKGHCFSNSSGWSGITSSIYLLLN